MVNRNIQMKKRNNNEWENLFPLTLTENVYNENGISLKNYITDNETDKEGFNSSINDIHQSIIDLDESIKTYAVNMEDFITDPTNASDGFQDAIDYANNKGYTKIIFPKSEYTFYDIIDINNDDLEIDFQDSNIYWKGEKDIGNNTRQHGFLNIEGEQGDLISHELQQLHPLFFMEEGDNWSEVSGLEFSTNLENEIPVGSFLHLNIRSGTGSDHRDYTPRINVMVEVLGYRENVMLIGYSDPFDWENVDITSVYIRKINPVKNVTIRNFNFIDLVEKETALRTNGTVEQRNKWVNPLMLKFAYNIKIENFKSEKHKFAAIMMYHSNLVSVDNITSSFPASLGAGEGYAIQANQSVYVNVRNIYGERNRHLIDFAGSSFCNVENARQGLSGGNYGHFDLHGICEHHISFTNTSGGMFIGNGWGSFPMLSKNVSITNHDGSILSRYIEDLKINNSDIWFTPMNDGYLNNVSITNSKVRFEGGSAFGKTSRGGVIDYSYFKMDNCEIYLQERNTYTLTNEVSFSVYDNLIISNSDLIDKIADGRSTFTNLHLLNNRRVSIDNVVNKNVAFRVTHQEISHHKFKNIDFEFERPLFTGSGYFVTLQPEPTMSPDEFSTIIFDGNTLTNQNEAPLRWLRITDGGNRNGGYQVTATNNHFLKNIEDSFTAPPNFIWNTFGNFMTGWTGVNNNHLSNGIYMTQQDKTTRNVKINNSGEVVTD